MTTVSAPASTANLGPGFDVLGLALALHVRAADSQLGTSDPVGPEHIARIAFEASGGVGDLWFDFEIPPSRGLGFSAAARAAGAVLAYRQQGMSNDDAQTAAYQIVAELEGHGDNAAPAVFGGMHVIAGDMQHRVSAPFPGSIVCWVPHDTSTPTDESRAKMPDMISRTDAVFNIGRIGLLMAAVYENRPELLAHATQDRLHQPTRLAAAASTSAALSAGLEGGATAGWLSGSGPTAAFVVNNENRADVLGALDSFEGGDAEVMELDIDNAGTCTRR